jgi:hypothetical protein
VARNAKHAVRRARHTLHIRHVTRHTSHVTRHMSHVTRHLQQHGLDVILIAHLKILDACDGDAAVEVEAVAARASA